METKPKALKAQLTPYAFFKKYAGYSYDPKTETAKHGAARAAMQLAIAEDAAKNLGFMFEWEHDVDRDSSDFSNEKPAWLLWVCCAYDVEGELSASLGGIDLGRDGYPRGNPYKRIVEAELALDILSRDK